MLTVHHRALASCALVVLAGCGPETKPPTTREQAEAPTYSEQPEGDECGAIEPRALDVFESGPAELVPDAISDLPESTGLETQDEGGHTPLMIAAQLNSAEAVSVLLEAGAEVEARDETGWTPLLLAAGDNPSAEVVSVLLKAGAEVEARTVRGRTSLMIAAQHNSAEVLLALLAAGADAKAEDKTGKRALDYAKDNKKLHKTPAYEKLKDVTLK